MHPGGNVIGCNLLARKETEEIFEERSKHWREPVYDRSEKRNESIRGNLLHRGLCGRDVDVARCHGHFEVMREQRVHTHPFVLGGSFHGWKGLADYIAFVTDKIFP